MSEKEAYDQLSLYMLAHGDQSFIHQHIVDAYAAQHPQENDKPVKTAFALVGLYLALEKNYSGKQVQQAHMELDRARKAWPHFESSRQMGDITVFDVMAARPGTDRDLAIMKWCASVWEAWHEYHQEVADLIPPR
ncbi:MAG: hypothetical protein JWL88_315 [Parcubacteria group bacterium]|nr:hypothetical protein [Parcubacteria group bacterium]